ncbi:MAG: electron transport complex subunit RsxG [Granulosicoccus sp.]
MNVLKRSGITLAVCVVTALSLLAAANKLTHKQIERSQHAWLSKSLLEVLPPGPYDNDPLQSLSRLETSAQGETAGPPFYRVFQNEQPYAAVLVVTTLNGYNGAIELLMGVHYSGELVGVRIIKHRETPGLGDDIEWKKSDWVQAFAGKTLSRATDWTVKKQGGKFDSFTGATITPKAVVAAVHEALQWFMLNREAVFSA